MKPNTFPRFAASFLALAFAGAAQAGSVGAGPAGTGSSVVGSVVISPASSNAQFNSTSEAGGETFKPGQAGTTQLSADQTAQIGAFLARQTGAVVSGPIIRVPTVLANGAAGVIILDTANGTLTVAQGD